MSSSEGAVEAPSETSPIEGCAGKAGRSNIRHGLDEPELVVRP